jgi:glutathione synthase/RimK-type ligase-like ATP-grasp enzyme
MNICIISPKISKESLAIKAEAESRGHVCKRIFMSDIYFEVKDGIFHAYHRKIDLLEYDTFVFRTISKYPVEARLLAEYLDNNDKTIIDPCLVDGSNNPLNMNYTLSKHGIPQPDECNTNGLKSARDVLMEMDHPILIKYRDDAQRLTSIVSEDWTESYDLVRTTKTKNFSFIKYTDARSFLQVFIIDSLAVAALHRDIQDKEPKLHYSESFQSSVATIDEPVKEIAAKACNALGIQIGTVDILQTSDECIVLDVHRAPNFMRFQKIAKVNVVEKIVDFIETTSKA